MKKIGLILGAVALLVAAQPASAQVSFGPQVSWGSEWDLGIGGRVHFDLGSAFNIEDGFFQDLFGMATGTYFMPDCGSVVDCSFMDISANVAVPFPVESSVMPYAGAGIGIGRFSSDVDTIFGGFGASGSNVGLNVLGGIFFPLGGLRGFAEAKYFTAGAGQFSLSGGILFGGS